MAVDSRGIPITEEEDIIVVGRKEPISAKQPGSFSINSFISDIRSRGVIRTHSFMVNIVPPKVLRNKWADMRNIIIRCDSAALPAANFQMNELYRHGYGPQESSPHNVQFEPINLTCLMDAKAEVYTFWYSWLNAIMNFNRQNTLDTKDEYGKYAYEMGYKDDYSTEIKILVYNEVAENIIQTSLLRAYPLGMSEISLNWMSTDDVARLNIPITYRDFYSQTTQSGTVNDLYDFLAPTISSDNFAKRSLRDAFQTIGFDIASHSSSKLDRLISDLILS